jgi:hypothetical protein
MHDVKDAGRVAMTLKPGEACVLVDETGRRLAAVLPNERHAGKMQIVVCAPRSVRIIREKALP